MERKKGGMEDAGIKGKEEKQEPPPIKTENKANEEKLSIKLETTESVLTSDVAMSLIVKSWKDCSIVEVLNSIELLGYEGVLVRGLSSRKFLEVENAEIKESILDELREEEFPVGIEEERDLPSIKENEDQDSSEESEESSPINNEKSKQYGPYQVVVDEQGQDGFVQGDVNLGEQVDFGMQGQVGSLHGSANSGEQILGDVRQHDRDNLQIVPVESREEEVVKKTPEASISKTSSNLIWSDREQSSSGSVKNAEECLLKLKLGRKRGRPAKRKSKKGNKPFALITTKSQLVCHGGSSEAEKIYESCLLMGLEGKVDREEAIKRIADRIREN
ncbi:hypothetical protein ACET3Z_021021 [Daucus carota]